jgi:PleD family two-component response regulator
VAQLSVGGNLDTLTRDADAALYRAKNAGRDTVSQ